MHVRLTMTSPRQQRSTRLHLQKETESPRSLPLHQLWRSFFLAGRHQRGWQKEEPFTEEDWLKNKKYKILMPCILINGKQVPVKVRKMSSGPKSKEVSLTKKKHVLWEEKNMYVRHEKIYKPEKILARYISKLVFIQPPQSVIAFQ